MFLSHPARDLTDWLLQGVRNYIMGTFNTVSPHSQLTIGDFLSKVKAEINPNCNFRWANEQLLKDNDVSCWSQLPLWVHKEIRGFLKVNSEKAISNGLKFRPISDSIRDTHKWSKPIYKDQYLNKVLGRDKEKKLLTSLKEL